MKPPANASGIRASISELPSERRFAAGVRWVVRGKDAGRVRIRRIWARPRTQHRAAQRGWAAQGFISKAALSLEARELVVEPPLELRVEARRVAGVDRLVARLARAAPAPAERAEDARAEQDARDREQPREQREAVLRRLGEDRLAEVRDEPALDLALRVARRDARGDELLDARRDRRVRLVERRAALGAHHLALELRQRRVPLARERRPGEHEREQDDRESPHCSARAIPSANRSTLSPWFTGPITDVETSSPRRLTKNVSG